jgi:hypothetical protein
MTPQYAAGLFDGEGYVRVARWKKPKSIHVRYQVFGGINMTHKPVILKLQKEFGGSVNQNRHDLRNPNHRVCFSWNISSQIAATFFRKILPHLIVKREEVKLALALQDNIDKYYHKLGHHHSVHPRRDQIFAYRAEVAEKISALKRRKFTLL